MRTNIVIDEQLIAKAQKLSGIQTKRAVVDEALRLLVARYEQTAVRNLRGKLHWEGDLDQMREDRFESVR